MFGSQDFPGRGAVQKALAAIPAHLGRNHAASPVFQVHLDALALDTGRAAHRAA